VNCSATDTHGNSSSKSFTVTVQDTTKPVVSVPADIHDTTGDPSGMVETFTATATDNIDGPLTPTCSPASGSKHAPGATTGTCSATGAHGNTGWAQFHVVITVDSTPPVITVPSNITVEATSAAGAAVSYTASAIDQDDPVASFGCSPASGSTFGFGTTTVTCN